MMNHVSNGYVGTKVLKSSLHKVKDDEQTVQQFEQGLNLSRNTMRFVGIIELIGSLFLLLSVFNKMFIRIGKVIINIVLGVAIFKHFKLGHGYKGSKPALQLFGLNVISFAETLRNKK